MQSQDAYRVQYSLVAIVELCEMKNKAQSLDMVLLTMKETDTTSWKMISVLAAAHHPELYD